MSYDYLDREDARNLLLRQATQAIDHYLRGWKREDGVKIQVRMEINPDLVEHAYGKDK